MREFFKSVIQKLFGEKPGRHDKYQCSSRSSSAAEFNCCIKESGHRGTHMSADGEAWF